ncbi:hypothetical protein [Raineyella sp. W15-4]|uniref:hypothetical protein n=1 Tax=Raineyella sp. W15-4 TaxID=3081651 RepID=UPI00295523F2|nr:hypothetical protein [Raineyella sp. W15-4]WOQ16783.1 hypothetical protein R0145_16480 [Raineyella sp. W15-4]
MISKDRNLRLPAVTLMVAGLAIVFMAVWSVVHWPAMVPAIVTREAAGNHGASVVPRGVTAAAMPGVLLVLTVLLMAVPAWDRRLRARISPMSGQQHGRGQMRVLGASLVGLSIFHIGLVGMYTGENPPMEQLVGAAAGVMLMILGVYLPVGRPDMTLEGPRWEAFRAAQGPAFRIGGFALVAVGLAALVAALLRPSLAIVIGPTGVAIVWVSILVVSTAKALRS